MSVAPGELRKIDGSSFKLSPTVSSEVPIHPYEEVILKAQGDIALIKGDKDPILALSFKTVEHPNPRVSSRGRRLFIAAPLTERILMRRGQVDTGVGYVTASGPIGETSVIFNESHLYI